MDADKKPFDIAALAATDEAELEILDQATIAIDNEQNARFVQREKQKEQAQVNGRKWKGSDETPEELRERSIGYIVARLLRWSDTTMDGKPLPCTPDTARTLLADRRMGLLFDQANGFLLEEKSFTKRSART